MNWQTGNETSGSQAQMLAMILNKVVLLSCLPQKNTGCEVHVCNNNFPMYFVIFFFFPVVSRVFHYVS
jgi:hypothetical protein